MDAGTPVVSAGQQPHESESAAASARFVGADEVVDDVRAGRLRIHPAALKGLPDAIRTGEIQFWRLDPTKTGGAGPDGFVGQVGVRWAKPRDDAIHAFVGDAANLAFLEVDKTKRGRGLGRFLVETVITAAQERSRGVYLTVEQNNEGAIKLYRKLGFRKLGLRLLMPSRIRNTDGTYTDVEPAPHDVYLRPH